MAVYFLRLNGYPGHFNDWSTPNPLAVFRMGRYVYATSYKGESPTQMWWIVERRRPDGRFRDLSDPHERPEMVPPIADIGEFTRLRYMMYARMC